MDDLGIRLRRVRELHHLSQRELARRSGVSNATRSPLSKTSAPIRRWEC